MDSQEFDKWSVENAVRKIALNAHLDDYQTSILIGNVYTVIGQTIQDF